MTGFYENCFFEEVNFVHIYVTFVHYNFALNVI